MCKIHYVGKSETSFNIRLNNHKKDTQKKTNVLEACKHSNNNWHTFSKHGKFITEQLRNINTIQTKTPKLRLRETKNFWVKKLKNVYTIWLKPRT